jgi:hypothetical protein
MIPWERKWKKKSWSSIYNKHNIERLKLKEKISVIKRSKKYCCQSGLTFQTCDLGYETKFTISKKHYEALFLTNSMSKDKIEKKINSKKWSKENNNNRKNDDQIWNKMEGHHFLGR